MFQVLELVVFWGFRVRHVQKAVFVRSQYLRGRSSQVWDAGFGFVGSQPSPSQEAYPASIGPNNDQAKKARAR